MEVSMIRPIDDLGRVALPREMLRTIGIHKDIPLVLRFHSATGELSLKQRQPSCAFCGSEKKLMPYRKLFFCLACKQSLADGIKQGSPP